MSLYTFAATNLTTADDRKRRPCIEKGQVIRILVFWLCLVLTLVVMAHQKSQAVEGERSDATHLNARAGI